MPHHPFHQYLYPDESPAVGHLAAMGSGRPGIIGATAAGLAEPGNTRPQEALGSAPDGEVALLVGDINFRVEELHAYVSALAARLNAVLPPTCAVNSADTVTRPAPDAFGPLACVLWSINDRLGDALRRVELLKQAVQV